MKKLRLAHKIGNFTSPLSEKFQLTSIPDVGKISTNVVLNGQFIPRKISILEKSHEVGLTVICGGLFSGTLRGSSTQSTTIMNLILG